MVTRMTSHLPGGVADGCRTAEGAPLLEYNATRDLMCKVPAEVLDSEPVKWLKDMEWGEKILHKSLQQRDLADKLLLTNARLLKAVQGSFQCKVRNGIRRLYKRMLSPNDTDELFAKVKEETSVMVHKHAELLSLAVKSIERTSALLLLERKGQNISEQQEMSLIKHVEKLRNLLHVHTNGWIADLYDAIDEIRNIQLYKNEQDPRNFTIRHPLLSGRLLKHHPKVLTLREDFAEDCERRRVPGAAEMLQLAETVYAFLERNLFQSILGLFPVFYDFDVTCPPALPIWGSYPLLLLQNYRFPYKVLDAMTRRYKSKLLGFYFGPFPAVAACDHESVKEVLNNPHLQGRVVNAVGEERNYHKHLGIFMTEGPQWMEQRRFSLRHLRDFGFGRRSDQLEGEVEAELRDLLELIRGGREDQEVVRPPSGAEPYRRVLMPDALFPAFVNAILSLYTGCRLPRSADATARHLSRAGLQFQRHGDSTGGFLTLHPWLAKVAPGLSGYRDGVEGSLKMRAYMEKIIQEHKDTYADDQERGFVDAYLKEIKERGEAAEATGFTEEQLSIILLDFFFPSATALSSAVTWALIYLVHHPGVMRRVQQELDAVVGRGRLPTLDDRPRLPYTEATLREVMRINTAVPISVPHKATEDTTLQGYSIPKGTVVITCLWSTHMDKDLWGDPENFRPERFLDQNGQLSKKDLSMPFGNGKRLCAGETFARNSVFLGFAALLQNFTPRPEGVPALGCNVPGTIETMPAFWAQLQPR